MTSIARAAFTLALLAAVAPSAYAHPALPPSTATSLYAPYAFLIGDWDVTPASERSRLVITFRWGPNQSYIWFAAHTLDDGHEAPHFEGMLMWNGTRGDLDMLVALDMNGGRMQEQGTMHAETDGSVVRDITAVYAAGVALAGGGQAGPKGATAHFRQTFRALAPDRIETAALRDNNGTWVATFPGSDHLLMTRRAAR